MCQTTTNMQDIWVEKLEAHGNSRTILQQSQTSLGKELRPRSIDTSHEEMLRRTQKEDQQNKYCGLVRGDSFLENPSVLWPNSSSAGFSALHSSPCVHQNSSGSFGSMLYFSSRVMQVAFQALDMPQRRTEPTAPDIFRRRAAAQHCHYGNH